MTSSIAIFGQDEVERLINLLQSYTGTYIQCSTCKQWSFVILMSKYKLFVVAMCV